MMFSLNKRRSRFTDSHLNTENNETLSSDRKHESKAGDETETGICKDFDTMKIHENSL